MSKKICRICRYEQDEKNDEVKGDCFCDFHDWVDDYIYCIQQISTD